MENITDFPAELSAHDNQRLLEELRDEHVAEVAVNHLEEFADPRLVVCIGGVESQRPGVDVAELVVRPCFAPEVVPQVT